MLPTPRRTLPGVLPCASAVHVARRQPACWAHAVGGICTCKRVSLRARAPACDPLPERPTLLAITPPHPTPCCPLPLRRAGIGPEAVCNAIMAVCHARLYLEQDHLDIRCIPSFQVGGAR